MTNCEHSQAEATACEALEDAIEDQQVVTFKYAKKPGEKGATRRISPYEVTGDITEGNLKVLGWDHERNALRSFNIDWQKLSDVTPDTDAEYRAPEP